MANAGGVLSGFGGDAHALCRRTWWVFVVGGVAYVVFGALALVSPGIALLVLATFFAASVLVDGVFNIAGSLRNREKDGWWIMLLIGILGLLAGGFALLNPPVSMIAFIYIVAFEAILLGGFLLMLGFKVRKATTREWMLYVTGALSIVFGVLVVANPLRGGLSIVFVIAAWAIVIGAFKIVFGFRVRKLPDRVGDRFAGLR